LRNTPLHTRRRALATLAASVIAAGCLAAPAFAQSADSFPNKPVRMVVPFPPGGTTDIFARIVADHLSRDFGHQVVVDNRPGAGGNTGSLSVARADPDGYTLLMGTVGTHAINPFLYSKIPFDAVADFAPVAFAAGVPNVLVVNPKNVKATTVKEFIAEAKAAKQPLNMASSGNGTSIHLAGEMFQQMTGVKFVHIPYKGSGPAVQDLVGGQVDLSFDNLPSSSAQIRAGNLRPIAMASLERSPAFPDVPTIDESGVRGFDAQSWFAVFAPAKTPKPIIDKLNAAINKIVEDPAVKQRYAEVGAMVRQMTPAELGAFMKAEQAKWSKVVKESGAKLD